MPQCFSPLLECPPLYRPPEKAPGGNPQWFLIDACLGSAESFNETSYWEELIPCKGSVICGVLLERQPAVAPLWPQGTHWQPHEMEVDVIDDRYQRKTAKLSTWRHGERVGIVRSALASVPTAPAQRQSTPRAARSADEPIQGGSAILGCLFCYGTLMRGEVRHVSMTRIGRSAITRGSVPGRLFDLGSYPGMFPPTAHADRTQGELHEFSLPDSEWAEALADLDRLEGFRDLASDANDYLRMLTWVRLAHGAHQLAWVYVYCGDESAMKPIEGNDWKQR